MQLGATSLFFRPQSLCVLVNKSFPAPRSSSGSFEELFPSLNPRPSIVSWCGAWCEVGASPYVTHPMARLTPLEWSGSVGLCGLRCPQLACCVAPVIHRAKLCTSEALFQGLLPSHRSAGPSWGSWESCLKHHCTGIAGTATRVPTVPAVGQALRAGVGERGPASW